MSGHTPGPWTARLESDLSEEPVWWIYSAHPEVGEVSHAEVRSGCDEADELGSMAANARLIAAAPDLLEALRELYVWANTNDPGDRDGNETAPLNRARAAIAKATGGV